jgi:hypothetical protein
VERDTESALKESKIQVEEALQDTGRWPFCQSEFLDFDTTRGYPSRFLPRDFGAEMPGV